MSVKVYVYTNTQKYIGTYAYECVSMGSLANKSPFHSVFIQFPHRHCSYIKMVCVMYI